MTRTTKTALLVFFLSLCAIAIVVTFRPPTRTPVPVPHELYSVVNSQLAAFRADDFTSAYRFAASTVREKFTQPAFEAMIRRNYAQMAHARRVEFGSAKVQGSAAVVEVFFIAADGSVRAFLYSLMAEGGAWKIDGAEEMPALPGKAHFSGSHA